MKKIKIILFTFLLTILFSNTAQAADEDFSQSNRIINASDVITQEQKEDLNNLSLEISEQCNKNIYVYFLSEEQGPTAEFIKSFIKEYNLSENVYVIGINPYLRTMYIHNEYVKINPTEILEKYSKQDFKNDNFYMGALNTMCGIADGYVRKEPEPEAPKTEKTPVIKLNSYITDEIDVLSAGSEEKIQSNSYRLKQNYGYDVYVYFTKSLENYNIHDFVAQTYENNFSRLSSTILIIISLEDETFHYACGNYATLNVDKVYNEYAKKYFHLDTPDYETGVCKLTNSVVATLTNMSIEDIENSVISGKTVNISNVSAKDIAIMCFLGVSAIALIILVIITIKKHLIDEERAKRALINDDPDTAFASLKEELDTVHIENLEYAKGVEVINKRMDDLYSEAASELTNDELLSESHNKNKRVNVFDPRFEEEKENDLVISSIDAMIEKVVKESQGTKEYYAQLQAALDVYNGLSFTNRTKLNRSFTSQLEALTRKARMDKEYAEKRSQ